MMLLKEALAFSTETLNLFARSRFSRQGLIVLALDGLFRCEAAGGAHEHLCSAVEALCFVCRTW